MEWAHTKHTQYIIVYTISTALSLCGGCLTASSQTPTTSKGRFVIMPPLLTFTNCPYLTTLTGDPKLCPISCVTVITDTGRATVAP